MTVRIIIIAPVYIAIAYFVSMQFIKRIRDISSSEMAPL